MIWLKFKGGVKIIFLFTIMPLIGMGGCQFAHADQKPDIGGKYEIKKMFT